MNKDNAMFAVIGLLAGVVIAGFVAGQSVNNNNTGMMRMMGMDTAKVEQRTVRDHSAMSMDEMSRQLEDLKGDDYDKAFTEMMIDHHQGAIDMAKLSDTRARHEEIKQLSKDIIAAQEKEITNMKQWQKDWSYSSDEMMNMMHGSR